MPTTEAEKKSTYNAKAQKKYNQKFKNIACKVDIQLYEKIKAYSELKGFKSLNSYLLYLIDEDLKNKV